MTTTLESITSGVNESRFLEHQRTLFSTSTSVLAECLQNARRAGASAVVFWYDVENSSLTITDDGCGIDDFRALITVAESDWSQETMDSEHPFGIGFSCVSFAAEKVRVESKGKQIEFSSEDLIAKRPIAVEPSDFIGGTRITLWRCNLGMSKVKDALSSYAKGFAIPVFWQGEALERPHAQANLLGKQTSVGFVYVPGIHCDRKDGADFEGYVYCQGLPVHVDGFSPRYDTLRLPVVHVDHLRYTPRVPDRDSLIDPRQATEDFCGALEKIWREHLAARKAELPSADFAESYWREAKEAGCLDLMADVPVLPAQILFYVGETPVLSREDESFLRRNDEPVTRPEVESGFARLMWTEKAKALFVCDRLPEQHWAKPYLRDLEEEEITISGSVLAEDYFRDGWVEGKVKLMQDLAVTISGITHPLTDAVVMTDPNSFDHTFLVPQEIDHQGRAGYVLRQASSYVKGCNNLCNNLDTDYENDAYSFDNLVAILSGEPAVETLKKSLRCAGTRFKTNLRNNKFCVRFDAEGKVTVTVE